ISHPSPPLHFPPSPPITPPSPTSPLFPYTTLFRSRFHLITPSSGRAQSGAPQRVQRFRETASSPVQDVVVGKAAAIEPSGGEARSEEHTSELQSRVDLVCRLLLEKKNEQKCDSLCV